MFARLDIQRLVTAIVLISAFTMAVRVPTSPDTWWHLRCGQVQWHTQRVLRSDVFSHTAKGTPWVNQSWLPQLAMYGLFVLGGFPALALAVAAVVMVAVAFVLAAARGEGRYGAFWKAFVVLWATISTGRTWAARPHLITFALSAAWLYLLDRYRAEGKGKWLRWLPPLMMVWANSHGGFIIGFLLLGAEIGGTILDAQRAHRPGSAWQRVGPLLIVTLLSALAASINPQGIRLLIFPFQTLGSFAQQNYVAEWASPNFHKADMLPFLALLLATWSALVFSGKRTAGVEGVRLLGFTAMSLRSGRYLGLCALVMAPLLVRHGASALAQLGKERPIRSSISPPARGLPALNWLLLTLLLAAAGIKISQPLNAQVIDQVHRHHFPVSAVDALPALDLTPTLFNEYNWGGYLIWKLYPDVPVFIDGRADPYGDELLTAYRRTILAQPGWERVLDEYHVHSALISAQSALALAMQQSDKWEQVYADDIAVIFVNTLVEGAYRPGGRQDGKEI